MELWFWTARVPKTQKNDPVAETPGEAAQQIYGKLPAELRDYEAPDPDGGTLFVGDKGTIFVGRGLVVGQGIGELDMMPIPENRGTAWRSCLYAHAHDFVRCVRSRSQPISNVPEQHRSLIPCHLTNLSLRLGRKLQWDPEREEFVGDDEATQRLKRTQRAPYQIEG